MKSFEKPQKAENKKEFPVGTVLDQHKNPYGENNLPLDNPDHQEAFEPVPTIKVESKTKKESAGDFATLKQLGKKIRELNDKYKSEMQKEEKELLYSQLEKAQREYKELEKKLDTMLMPTEQEKKMFRLKELKELIRELNDRYKSEMQREEKAKLWNQLEAAQKEYRKLEEELDTASNTKKKPEQETPETPTPESPTPDTSTPEPPKTPENKETLILILIGLLEKAKGGDPETVKVLIEFITTHKIEIVIRPESTPEEIKTRELLIILLEKIKGGDITVINQIIQIINVVNISITNITVITPPKPTPPTGPGPVPPTPESISSLDELRDAYLKAKRLRGNVFRGGIGRFFKRKLHFGKEEMDFGGKEGAADLEKVRKEYEEKLAQYRLTKLQTLSASLEARFAAGLITPAQATIETTKLMIDLQGEEDNNIDARSENGIEKNLFEKMKTKWRQMGKTRLVAGALLGGAAMATGGTALGAGLVGARAVMGGIGTYVGVESALERYGKTLGHVGLINEINKKGPFATEADMDTHISSLSDADVKKEAARLRMLQVEKGVAMKNVGDKGKIALAILKRNNELVAKEATSKTHLENPALGFAGMVSSSLAKQIDSTNELVESEVDKERVKKMFRKTTAALAGGAIGWIIGGKLFDATEPTPPPIPHNPPIPEPITPEPYTVGTGDNTWKIIESNLDSQNTMAGLSEGARTHMIDALKDGFDNMSPSELKDLGFSSGDANLLYVGDSLEMSSILDNPEIITKTLLNAKHLPTKDMIEIVKNNTTIAKWLVAHYSELKTPLNSSVIEQVLKGIK